MRDRRPNPGVRGVSRGGATLSAGLMPAIQASRTALHPDLTRTATSRIGRLRTSLVGIEVAISLVLLLTAALLLRGVARASAVDPGMPVDNLLAISMDADRHGYEGTRLDAIVREARRHIEGLPGVRSTALVNPAPFSGARSATGARRGDAPDSPGRLDVPRGSVAGLSRRRRSADGSRPLVQRHRPRRGRDQRVARQPVVGRTADPLGQRLTTGDFNRRSHVVVGVVRDAPYAELRHQHEPFLFRPGRRERSWSARRARPRP